MNPSDLNYGLRPNEVLAIIEIFKQFPHLEKAILYGSRAKGNFRPGSDIDLTLQGENLVYQDLISIEGLLDDLLLPYTFDLSIYHLIDNSDLIDHINRLGIEFYSKVGFAK